MKLDYEQMSAELLRALRGTRSQVAFSRRLGYRANVSYTWESGRHWPTASTFLRAAGRVGINVDGGLRRFFRIVPPWLDGCDIGTPAGVEQLLGELRGSTPVVALAERVGHSRFAVSRWLRGEAEPRLPDLLRLIEATSARVLDFVALFADPAALRSTRAAWSRVQAARSLFLREPWAQVVLLALELEEVRTAVADVPAVLAERLGLELADVVRCLDALVSTGQVVRRGDRWLAGDVQAVDTRTVPELGRFLKEFWAKEAIRRIGRGDDGLFSYTVFTVSDVDYERLRDLHLKHFQSVRAIVAASEPAERLVFANLHLAPLTRGTDPGRVGG